MDNDDRQLGQILSRREVLALLGAGGVTMLLGCGPAQPSPTPAVAPTNSAVPTTATQATVAPVPMAATSTGAAITATSAATATVLSAATAVTPAASTAAATKAASATADGASAAVPSCVVRPEVTEGPYYVNEELNRSDLRADPGTGTVKAGVPLTLTFNVSQIVSGGCTPLPGAKVEIWHCDAAGVYSDVSDRGASTKGQQFLRGYQVTDASGRATFTTIYPGWYPGRAVHIHFKVHPDASKVFTSQLFFDDALSTQVFAQAPYAGRGRRDTLNSRDSIYKDVLLMPTAASGQGYAASFDIGIQKT